MGLIEDYVATAQPAIVSKKLMQILNKMARVDQLTGMYNRKYLDEFADKGISQALRTKTPYGILMVDIDFFKMINDTYGHDVGDEAIRIIARVIKDTIRKSDIAIRFGGEEFLVLLHNCDSIWKCIKFADMSLYYAKEHGRNQVVCYDESLFRNNDMKNQF